MILNSIGNLVNKNVNFCGYNYSSSNDYWNCDDFNNNVSCEKMPEPNCKSSDLSAFYDDVFEHEAQNFMFKQKHSDTYKPKILGTYADGLDDAYRYCMEHNVPSNTFMTNNAEFSEIDLYC